MSDDLHSVIRALESRIAELEAERRPRRARARRVSRRVAAGLLALVLLVPGVALASHQFTDVPNSNSFHGDIDWLADYGITGGCGATTFCPGSAVTRGQMAAFMHRLSNEFELVTETIDPEPADFFFLTTDCPGDKRAIGGGGSTSNVNVFITDSFPSAESSWFVRWETDDDVTADPSEVKVWALCAPRL